MVVGGQLHAPAALPPEMTQYPLYRRLGRPQGRSGRVLKISPLPGFDHWTVQLVVSRYTNYAIPAHKFTCGQEEIVKLRTIHRLCVDSLQISILLCIVNVYYKTLHSYMLSQGTFKDTRISAAALGPHGLERKGWKGCLYFRFCFKQVL
jgi:hypothetical protein